MDGNKICCFQRRLSKRVSAISKVDVQLFTAQQSGWLMALGAAILVALVLRAFSKGSRKYEGNVGDEYDAWTREGILEHYWGEHIHLGYYGQNERRPGFFAWGKKSFIQAKYDFIDEMLKWSGTTSPQRILDVGCGFGGTSRKLASIFVDAKVEGITLSQEQVNRGTNLSRERGLENVELKVMDALAMEYEDNSFDLVWACESGEHMPDKKKYIEEMTRVLKPGGTLVIACWCQRDEANGSFSAKERAELQFLYDEWAHPYFISREEFIRLMDGTGRLDNCVTENWVDETLPSWRQSIWVGVESPWFVLAKMNPRLWWKCIRDAVCLERMHRAFRSGLMEYGMMKAVKVARIAGAAEKSARTAGYSA